MFDIYIAVVAGIAFGGGACWVAGRSSLNSAYRGQLTALLLTLRERYGKDVPRLVETGTDEAPVCETILVKELDGDMEAAFNRLTAL